MRGESVTVPALALSEAREILRLDYFGRPRCPQNHEIVRAISAIVAIGAGEAVDEIVRNGFLADAEERYAAHVEPRMRVIGGHFAMGSDAGGLAYFQGESPPHGVALSPFAISAVPVTNGLYRLFGPGHAPPRGADDHPVTDVTWYDAVVCAAWFGCLLPTEAQWEFACGAGSPHQWCCDEPSLCNYAWYSENAAGAVHPVGTRAPNSLGLFDLHGQVWEWCRDDYDAAYYSRAPGQDPVNLAGPASLPAPQRHKVTRGGSFCSLAEMCRSRFRFHEPAGFWAHDLGFRLVSTRLPSPGEGHQC